MRAEGLNFIELAAFVDVCESGSITASARRLDTSKSVVSTRIAALESDLAVTLFRRSSSRLTLTPKGEELYARATAILWEMRRLREEIAEDKSELRGTLRIAVPTSFAILYLSHLFARFMHDHPGVDLILDLDDRKTDIAGGGYDMGIRIGQMTDTSLIGRRICAVRRVVCCSPSYAEAKGVPSTVRELTNHVCLTYGNILSTAHWLFQPRNPGDDPVPVQVPYRLVANNGEVQRDAAIAGVGLLLIPSFMIVDALRAGTLTVVPLDLEPSGLECFLLYPRQRHPPGALRALMDFLLREIGDPPVWERQLANVPGYASE
jgi:DNA-binding transcriptional LysR family regulator